MNEQADSTQPDFWTKRYASGKTPWDFRGVPAALKSFLAGTFARGAVLIPGCGSGYEIQAFHEAGFEVTAIDFSAGAIEKAKVVLGSLAQKILSGDFFTYDFLQNRFDLIYERTFLCSLPPNRWPDYARRMAALLKPNGKLAGIFLYGRESEPPPFPLAENQGEKLFGKAFRLTRDEPVADSLPIFKGMERWQEWAKAQTN